MLKTSFTLRPAGARDRSVIRSLIRRVRINPTGLDWRRFTVATDGQGNVIGCGQIKPRSRQVDELASIAVEPAWRRQGVASAIIHSLMHDRQSPLWLVCREELVPFYRRFGFRPVDPEVELPTAYVRLRRLARLFRVIAPRGSLPAVLVWIP